MSAFFIPPPYDNTEGGYTGISFSGSDIENIVTDSDRRISVVQSGNKQFMLMRTAATDNVTNQEIKKTITTRFNNLISSGADFEDAVNIAAQEGAKDNGLAYYEGSGGKFTKIK